MAHPEFPHVDINVVRDRITILNSRVITRLEDRSRFPLNPSVYRPGAVILPDDSNRSKLEYTIEEFEKYHAKLGEGGNKWGRWEYADQYPLIISIPADTPRRPSGELPVLPYVDINLKDKLLLFYTDSALPQITEQRDDPDTHGETPNLDADLLELLNERMNLGRYVAVSKIEVNPDIWDIVSDSVKLAEALRDRGREKFVIRDALKSARRHGLIRAKKDLGRIDVERGWFVRGFFRWVIDHTLDLEVKYLQGVIQD